ncbi:hypothetical protein, partial [Escherichia coli]|uniref:hypothetical protein n=1 Tax=Escherichia coli TaxID=562 RepID=UPI0030C77086
RKQEREAKDGLNETVTDKRHVDHLVIHQRNRGSHENVPPDVVKPAGVVMKTARHLHWHNNRGET